MLRCLDLEDTLDKPREECGIFGIFSGDKKHDVSKQIFFALYALQHRGQEGAGIATVGEYGRMSAHRGVGLVMQVFNEENMQRLHGNIGIGHTRYSTAGSSTLTNAQPFMVETNHGALAIAHNGQLAGANKLRRKLMSKGVGMFTTSDSEVVAQMLAAPTEGEEKGPNWEKRLAYFIREVEGAFSVCVIVKDALFGIRDRLGMRPLSIGSYTKAGRTTYILSSESCAFSTIGATLVRDVHPGEIVRIDSNGLYSVMGYDKVSPGAFCIFEYVYFARPDSIINNILVHSVRQNLGRELAREQPCPEADVVVGVPDSSIPMAIGYSQESGIPFTEGLCKNRYIGRTFINPDDEMRVSMVNLKYNPLSQNLFGKNVVVVDDSLVRGHTVSQLVNLFKSAGCKSLHVRIASAPLTHPCFMGIDMKSKQELIAGYKSVEEIKKIIGADSLAYLSHEGMLRAVRASCTEEADIITQTTEPDRKKRKIIDGETEKKISKIEEKLQLCSACFTGKYPLDIEDTQDCVAINV